MLEDIYAPIYDQGVCGNCYAYTTVDGLNLHNKIRGNKVPRLSIQQLTECSSNSSLKLYNFGCQGGKFHISLLYMAKSGLNKMKDYPTRIETLTEGKLGECEQLDKKVFKVDYWYNLRVED